MSNKSSKSDIAISRGKRVKFLRLKVAAMSGEAFSKCCQLSRGTITNWETGKGKNGLSEKGAKQIVQAMQCIGISCTVTWLLHGIGDFPNILDQNKLLRLHYPSALQNQSNHISEPYPNDIDDFLDEIALFKEKHPSHLLYTFHDESMDPMYHIQDCVGGPCLTPDQFPLIKNNICIILLALNQLMVRRVRIEGPEMSSMSFYVVNPERMLEHPPMARVPLDSIVALAPITRVWRTMRSFYGNHYPLNHFKNK